jgi:SDR family mycofactocin-dependent oxidoreductase
MGRVANKVALVTGAARGQGRSDAVRLAEEGADLILLDLCGSVDSVPYPLPSEADLYETARLASAHGAKVLSRVVDVRDDDELRSVVTDGVREMGSIDVMVAAAGVLSFGLTWEMTRAAWQDMIDINLTGAWLTAKAVIPSMIDAGRGGSLVFHSSKEGLKGLHSMGGYSASKHGVTGLMRTLSLELAPEFIRANSINATVVDTPMVHNEATYAAFMPDIEAPTREDAAAAFAPINAMPIGWVDTGDVSNAVLFLASDESRYVSGVALPVDAGALYK